MARLVRPDLGARFWAHVDRRGSGECWLWRASLGSTGYGQFNVDRRVEKAHRVAWKLTRGSIPAGLLVCHTCDNRRCVNPAHLFLGTVRDNTADMMRKGRGQGPPHRSGSANNASKLTEESVQEIRQRLRGGEPTTRLSKEFGVSPAAIWWIKVRRNWAHVA
jgi:HNH endonuclease